MSCMCWNVQSLGNPETLNALQDNLRKNSSGLVFLSNTKLTSNWATSVHWSVGFTRAFVVDCVGRSGELLLLWKDDWDVTIQSFLKGHIDAEVASLDGDAWHFTRFYGNPNMANRRLSWELLLQTMGYELENMVMWRRFQRNISFFREDWRARSECIDNSKFQNGTI